MCLDGPVVLGLDRRRVPFHNGPSREVAHRELHPVRRVRTEIAIRPASGRRFAEAGAATLADRAAERAPALVEACDHRRRCPWQGRLELRPVLDEVDVGLARDEPDGHEVNVAIGRQRAQDVEDALVGPVEPRHDVVRGAVAREIDFPRVPLLNVEHPRPARAQKTVRELGRDLLHPEGEVAEHRFQGPPRRARVRKGREAQPAERAAQRAPALANPLEELRGPRRNGGEYLIKVLRVVPVRVAGDHGDDPVLVSVDLLGREHLDLGDDPLVSRVELAHDLAPVATPRARDHGRVELVGVVDPGMALRLTALAENIEPVGRACLPRRRVRGDVLVRPARRGLLLERREAEGPEREPERDPVRPHETEEVVAAADGRADVRVMVRVMPGRVPLHDLGGETRRVVRERLDGLKQPVVRGAPPGEQLVRRPALRLRGHARVEHIDLVVELGIFAALEHRRDPWRHGLLPRGQVREVLVERPARRKRFAEAVGRQRLERRAQPPIALADLPAERVLRNTPDRGTHRTPPSARPPARRRSRTRGRTRETAA